MSASEQGLTFKTNPPRQMTMMEFDKLTPRDFEDCVVRAEIRTELKTNGLYKSALVNVEIMLKEIAQKCSCGATSEEPRHAPNCQIGLALMIINHTKDAENGIRKIRRG